MRRLLLLVTILLSMTATITPTPAQAAATCSIHDANIDGWSIQTDVVDTSWDFKCGAAFNDTWFLRVLLQWQDTAGAWHTFDCDNGSTCDRLKPNTGVFAAGSEHTGTDTWNVMGAIDCHVIRLHVRQIFTNVSSTNYNSLTTHIGGC